MKTQVNIAMFIEAFKAMDRVEQFGYEALGELFDHIEDFEQDTGEEFELDVIALCCDWSVMTREEILEQYSDDLDDYITDTDNEEFADEVRAQLDTYCYDLSNGSYLICTGMI